MPLHVHLFYIVVVDFLVYFVPLVLARYIKSVFSLNV